MTWCRVRTQRELRARASLDRSAVAVPASPSEQEHPKGQNSVVTPAPQPPCRPVRGSAASLGGARPPLPSRLPGVPTQHL